MEFAKVLATLKGFLEERQFRFGMAGALALSAYGLSRATADLDLVVERRAQKDLVAWLEGLGFETVHVSDGYSNHAHSDPALGRLDFIYLDASTSDRMFGEARRIEVFPGLTVAVPRPEHLAAMKVLAMKNDPARVFRDMADLQFLVALPGVDRELIRDQFKRYGMEEKFDELEKTIRQS